MKNRGQTSLEIMMIVVILLGLLLATAYIMMERNNDINRISTIQRDMQKCDSIASKITSLSSNRGYGKAIVTELEKDARIEKGSVIVGNISCSYKGDVWFDEIDSAADGFDLIKGTDYAIKTFETASKTQGVSFNAYAN